MLSAKRAAGEAINNMSDMEMFDFRLNPHVNVCKTIAINFLNNSLAKVQSTANDNGKRRMAIANLKKDYRTGGLPVTTKGMGEIIFDSRQTAYKVADDRYAHPDGTWETFNGKCVLQGFANNQYMDLNGNLSPLYPNLSNDDMKVITAINRNLVFLKRVMIDLGGQKFKNEIGIIDAALDNLKQPHKTSINFQKEILTTYHNTLKLIKPDKLLEVKKDTKGVRFETGVSVELKNLDKIIRQAKKPTPPLSYQLLGTKEKFKYYLGKVSQFFHRKETKYQLYENDAEFRNQQNMKKKIK